MSQVKKYQQGGKTVQDKLNDNFIPADAGVTQNAAVTPPVVTPAATAAPVAAATPVVPAIKDDEIEIIVDGKKMIVKKSDVIENMRKENDAYMTENPPIWGWGRKERARRANALQSAQNAILNWKVGDAAVNSSQTSESDYWAASTNLRDTVVEDKRVDRAQGYSDSTLARSLRGLTDQTPAPEEPELKKLNIMNFNDWLEKDRGIIMGHKTSDGETDYSWFHDNYNADVRAALGNDYLGYVHSKKGDYLDYIANPDAYESMDGVTMPLNEHNVDLYDNPDFAKITGDLIAAARETDDELDTRDISMLSSLQQYADPSFAMLWAKQYNKPTPTDLSSAGGGGSGANSSTVDDINNPDANGGNGGAGSGLTSTLIDTTNMTPDQIYDSITGITDKFTEAELRQAGASFQTGGYDPTLFYQTMSRPGDGYQPIAVFDSENNPYEIFAEYNTSGTPSLNNYFYFDSDKKRHNFTGSYVDGKAAYTNEQGEPVNVQNLNRWDKFLPGVTVDYDNSMWKKEYGWNHKGLYQLPTGELVWSKNDVDDKLLKLIMAIPTDYESTSEKGMSVDRTVAAHVPIVGPAYTLIKDLIADGAQWGDVTNYAKNTVSTLDPTGVIKTPNAIYEATRGETKRTPIYTSNHYPVPSKQHGGSFDLSDINHGPLRKRVFAVGEKDEDLNKKTDLTANDWMDLTAASADIASAVVGFVPGANIVSGAIGAGATTAGLAAGISRDGLDMGDVGRATTGYALDALSFIPIAGGAAKTWKAVKAFKNVAPLAIKALNLYGSVGVATEATRLYDKVSNGEDFTVEDLKSLAVVMGGISRLGMRQGVAAKHKRDNPTEKPKEKGSWLRNQLDKLKGKGKGKSTDSEQSSSNNTNTWSGDSTNSMTFKQGGLVKSYNPGGTMGISDGTEEYESTWTRVGQHLNKNIHNYIPSDHTITTAAELVNTLGHNKKIRDIALDATKPVLGMAPTEKYMTAPGISQHQLAGQMAKEQLLQNRGRVLSSDLGMNTAMTQDMNFKVGQIDNQTQAQIGQTLSQTQLQNDKMAGEYANMRASMANKNLEQMRGIERLKGQINAQHQYANKDAYSRALASTFAQREMKRRQLQGVDLQMAQDDYNLQQQRQIDAVENQARLAWDAFTAEQKAQYGDDFDVYFTKDGYEGHSSPEDALKLKQDYYNNYKLILNGGIPRGKSGLKIDVQAVNAYNSLMDKKMNNARIDVRDINPPVKKGGVIELIQSIKFNENK